eukprot:c32701_g1_i1.p1 GENE.c32701_g1_i1~~c32701_g1_i1.p1  ORF type:complete len:449 (+),score=101.97 c32701_g1_i1:124-1347(+)
MFHSTQPCQATPLSQSTIDIVKATVPVLEVHGYAIVKNFYKHMFANHPEVRVMFNQSHQVERDGNKAQQPLTLACTVHAFAKYVDNPAILEEAIERIVQKHVSLYVLPNQYDIVGSNLLWAIKHTLGDAATPDIMKAWGEAYGFLAEVLIEREATLRNKLRDQQGGWEGWRDFVVADKVPESSIITSFYLKPKDGGAIPVHLPGQYMGFVVNVPGKEKSTRNYTISSVPGKNYYRITVKREPFGVMSSFLHDQVDVGHTLQVGVPCGDFFLIEDRQKPIVFISGGVGLTPVVSMLEHAVTHGFKQPITYLDVVRDTEVEAMHNYFQKISSRNLNVNVKFIYDNPPSEDFPKGPVSIDHIKLAAPTPDAHFYLCGPRGFMTKLVGDLKAWGVPANQIHHEVFGSFGMA